MCAHQQAVRSWTTGRKAGGVWTTKRTSCCFFNCIPSY